MAKENHCKATCVRIISPKGMIYNEKISHPINKQTNLIECKLSFWSTVFKNIRSNLTYELTTNGETTKISLPKQLASRTLSFNYDTHNFLIKHNNKTVNIELDSILQIAKKLSTNKTSDKIKLFAEGKLKDLAINILSPMQDSSPKKPTPTSISKQNDDDLNILKDIIMLIDLSDTVEISTAIQDSMLSIMTKTITEWLVTSKKIDDACAFLIKRQNHII